MISVIFGGLKITHMLDDTDVQFVDTPTSKLLNIYMLVILLQLISHGYMLNIVMLMKVIKKVLVLLL